MAKFDVYIKENKEDIDYLTYYTTIEADSQEEAEEMADDIYDSIQSSKENYELEADYDAKGDELN